MMTVELRQYHAVENIWTNKMDQQTNITITSVIICKSNQALWVLIRNNRWDTVTYCSVQQ